MFRVKIVEMVSKPIYVVTSFSSLSIRSIAPQISALPSEHYAAFYRTRAAEIVESARVVEAEAETEADAETEAEHALVRDDEGRAA
jgi:hypothetical protein